MMYMHYCKKCHRIMMLTGHKMICPRCTDPLTELRISYLDYVDLGPGEREALLQKCANESELSGLKTTYRMYKYTAIPAKISAIPRTFLLVIFS